MIKPLSDEAIRDLYDVAISEDDLDEAKTIAQEAQRDTLGQVVELMRMYYIDSKHRVWAVDDATYQELKKQVEGK